MIIIITIDTKCNKISSLTVDNGSASLSISSAYYYRDSTK